MRCGGHRDIQISRDAPYTGACQQQSNGDQHHPDTRICHPDIGIQLFRRRYPVDALFGNNCSFIARTPHQRFFLMDKIFFPSLYS